MKILEIVNAYKVLGEIHVYNLEDNEIVKILNARIEMKQHVDKYNSFLEDAKEKCKPSDYAEKSELMLNWSELDDSVRKELNAWLKEYNNKINNVVKDFAE